MGNVGWEPHGGSWIRYWSKSRLVFECATCFYCCSVLFSAAIYIIFDDFCHGISPLLNEHLAPCMFFVQWYDFFGLFPVKER